MLYVDQVGKTEDEAVELACRKMRLERSDVVVQSVKEVPDGVLVRAAALRSRGKEVADILDLILKRLGIKAELFYIESCEKVLINLKGPHLGLIIGKSGSTLEALETIIGAMHNRDYALYKPIVINPGGYRENKRKALKILVQRACDAAEDGQKIPLPVMRQRERKQVHQIIKDFVGFRSRSVGDGNDRHIMIFRESEDDSEGDDDQDSVPSSLLNQKNDPECDFRQSVY